MGPAEEIFIKMVGFIAGVSPVVRDFIEGAIAAKPDHVISRRVADVMPARTKIHDVVDELEKG